MDLDIDIDKKEEKPSEPEQEESKVSRVEKKQLSRMKIITAIALGKDRNKDIAKFLDTDKSYAAKRVKELESQGLVTKEGEGKHVKYRVNEINVLQFLQSKIIITRGTKDERKDNERDEE